ncbi:MAG: TolC family protein [Bacteroidetes bacterium]|nr:TolC family protein [Bacteroidota bacterium]
MMKTKMNNPMNLSFRNMQRELHRFFVSIVLIFSIMHVNGQNLLTLKDAMKEGLDKHYGIRIARNESDMAERNVSIGNAGFYPVISAYATIDKASQDAEIKVVTGSELKKSAAPSTITTAGISAGWTLYDGSRMFIRFDKLLTFNKLGHLGVKQVMEKAVSDITLAYYNVVLQNQLLKTCQERLKVSNLRLRLATMRKGIGSGSEYEMLQAGVDRQADTVACISQLTLLQNARVWLNQLLACDLQRDYLVEDTILLTQLPSLDELSKKALDQNSELLIQQANLEVSELDLRYMKAQRQPVLGFRAAYGYYENETQAAFIKYNQLVGPQFGFTAGMPLFDGFNLNRKIRNAKVMMENEQIRNTDDQQRVLAALIKTYNENQKSLQIILLNREGISLAQKNLKIALEAFQAGMISSLQLREAQQGLFNAESSLFEALYLAKEKETELLRISGLLVL